jgi:hypothetical protein
MKIGTCKLCLTDNVPLHKSHLLPAALYRGRKKGKKLEVTTYSGVLETDAEIKQPLLCHVCEQRFDQGGEAHVLEAISPKAGKTFRLNDLMRIAYARDSDPSISRFYGPDFDLEMDKFAYFAISVIWRVTACQWVMQDGTLTQEVNLGTFQENMRRYLLGEIPLPADMAVIVIVCSDLASRKSFFHPAGFIEADCINFRFLARGVNFRVMMGYQMSTYLRQSSCTSNLKCIWYGDCEKRTIEALHQQPVSAG